jgi:hypothetical protein
VSEQLRFLSLKLTFLSLKLTCLSVKLTFLSLKLTCPRWSESGMTGSETSGYRQGSESESGESADFSSTEHRDAGKRGDDRSLVIHDGGGAEPVAAFIQENATATPGGRSGTGQGAVSPPELEMLGAIGLRLLRTDEKCQFTGSPHRAEMEVRQQVQLTM